MNDKRAEAVRVAIRKWAAAAIKTATALDEIQRIATEAQALVAAFEKLEESVAK